MDREALAAALERHAYAYLGPVHGAATAAKFRAGQREHAGDADRSDTEAFDPLAHALEEALDLFCYVWLAGQRGLLDADGEQRGYELSAAMLELLTGDAPPCLVVARIPW